ncbi:MAG: C_GCAxxG_C_C family protein [Chloroflexi bacterium]|nr:C_GCAxxG_C_C family protein [Chloroflexota bacterium]MBI2980558.1 C_GCAxxG_C_C family protein [Chloroflexota bacterium]
MTEHRINCAQSEVSVFCEELGLDRDKALKVAMGFGGGMGRTGNTCGAVTGAYMVLGLAQEILPDNPRTSIDRTYELVREFNQRFKTLHDSLTCKELLGCDISMPEGVAEARDKKLFTSACPDFVRDSVKILETLLQLT